MGMRRESALLASVVLLALVDQGTKLWATETLTHRLDGVSGLPAKLARMYSPDEYRGADGRAYVRNYAFKREHLFGRHLALHFGENEGVLHELEEARPGLGPWVTRSVWLALSVLALAALLRWGARGGKLSMGFVLVAGAVVSAALDFSLAGFTVEWLELRDVVGWTARGNLAELCGAAGTLLLAVTGLQARASRGRR